MTLNFHDFQKQNVKFDIDELQKAYKEILSIKGFTGVDGISNFGAISLTQIPGDPDSIKGNKARGVFWTKPDSSGKEAMRDEMINESAYSEFIEDFPEMAQAAARRGAARAVFFQRVRAYLMPRPVFVPRQTSGQCAGRHR